MTTPALITETASAPILIVEAVPGPGRKRWLAEYVKQASEPAARISTVSCDFDLGGPWAGVNGLLSEILPDIQQHMPGLLGKHAFEVVHVVPRLRETLIVQNPTLTDLASDDEKVRNYAADRAYRIVHGIIDMLDSWKTLSCPETPWIIGCDAYDLGGPLTQYFFKELMRRRGNQLRIQLIATVKTGQGNEAISLFNGSLPAKVILAEVPNDPEPAMSPEEAFRKASELTLQVGENRIEKQVHLPELIRLWTLANRPDGVLIWRYFGLAFYSKLGLYADSLRYGEGLLELVEKYDPTNARLRWWIIIKLLNAYTGLANVEAALALSEAALKETGNLPLSWGIHLYYMAAMLHARFKQPRDLVMGEKLLDRGLEVIQQSDISEQERHFRTVFNRNGVAMIRTFQGRFQDAIDLCTSGFKELDAYLSVDKHHLHRSILLYNIAQVYVAIDSYPEAVEYFTAAMAMDPNYSEYYNERGSIFLRTGRLQEAHADYLKAIELSPPYFEVFTNLGQCYRRMGMMEEAIRAYTRSLDLEPNQALALLGRGKANEELGRTDSAIADYTAAIELDPAQWDAFASRAVMHYEKRELEKALSDFDHAIDLNPKMVDLYQNRAFIFTEMGRPDMAASDLRAALLLNPPPEDSATLTELLKTAEASFIEQAHSKSA